MSDFLQIFFAGIILANGPCLFICIPVVIPSIGGFSWLETESSGWKMGLKFVLIFSFFRLTAYSLLGFLSVVFYQFVFGVIAPRGLHLQLILGFFIVGLGLVYCLNNLFRKSRVGNPIYSFCSLACQKLNKKTLWGMALLGLLIGFSPCPPLLAVLTYIAASAPNPLWGLFAGLIFGLGTIITPLIPLGVFAGFFVDKVRKNPKIHLWVKLMSGIILIYFGAKLIIDLF